MNTYKKNLATALFSLSAFLVLCGCTQSSFSKEEATGGAPKAAAIQYEEKLKMTMTFSNAP